MQNCTDQQREAAHFGTVLAGGKGVSSPPQLIIAGAGTGKTNTLAHRAAFLILNGVEPSRILLMTFSRRAAQELCSRVERIVFESTQKINGSKPWEGLSWMGTFHSVANRLLRRYATSIGMEADFSIMDRSDAADQLDVIRHQLGFTTLEKRFPKKATCLEVYSRCVNAQAPLSEVLQRDFPWCAEWQDELNQLFGRYVAAKQQQSSLDYDDLLLYWYHLAGEPKLAKAIRQLYDHILVDEYQDTNRLQAGILLRLFPDGNGLTVVGDDAQSIYGFRAAEVDNILSFPQCFDPPATLFPLSENFRSNQPILDLSNALLKDSKEGYKNYLHSGKSAVHRPKLVTVDATEQQSQYVVEKILEAREGGTELKQQAVLFRSSHHSDHLEIELRRRDIPYVKHGGLKFLEASHVKDVLCILRWADNPKHRLSGFRVLKLMPGIGPKLAEKILDQLEIGGFAFAALKSLALGPLKQELWHELVNLLTAIQSEEVAWTDQLRVIGQWYQPLLETNYNQPFARYGDIEQLMEIAQQSPTRESFLSDLILDPPSASGIINDHAQKDDDFLILSTVHSAKGQEWHDVYLLNVADGNFPNEYAAADPKALEEERRLLYVALTRAKQNLHLLQPLKYWIPEQQRFGGKHVYGAKSRFFTESVLANIQQISYPEREITEADREVGYQVLTDIKQKIASQWG